MGVIVVRHPQKKGLKLMGTTTTKEVGQVLSRNQGNKCLPNFSNGSILHST